MMLESRNPYDFGFLINTLVIIKYTFTFRFSYIVRKNRKIEKGLENQAELMVQSGFCQQT